MVESEAAVDLQMFPIDRKAHAASPPFFLNATGPRPSPTGLCLVCRQREEHVGNADVRVHRVGVERFRQLRDGVRITKTQ